MQGLNNTSCGFSRLRREKPARALHRRARVKVRVGVRVRVRVRVPVRVRVRTLRLGHSSENDLPIFSCIWVMRARMTSVSRILALRCIGPALRGLFSATLKTLHRGSSISMIMIRLRIRPRERLSYCKL